MYESYSRLCLVPRVLTRPHSNPWMATVFLLLTALVVIAGFAVHCCTAMNCNCRSMNCTDSLPVTCARFLCQQSFLPVLPVTYCINNITYDLNSKAPPANTGSFASPTIPMSATQTNGSDFIGISATCMPRENPVDALCNEAHVSVSANDGSTGLELLAEVALISDSINNSQASTHMHEAGGTAHLTRSRGGTEVWSLVAPESKAECTAKRVISQRYVSLARVKRLRVVKIRRTISHHLHHLQRLLGLPLTSSKAKVLSFAIQLIGSHANLS